MTAVPIIEPRTHPGCVRCARPDVTDLRNDASGPCVICDAHVLKRQGWRARVSGRWAVCCDRHVSPARPKPPVAERAQRLAERARAGAEALRLPI
jgi:hypothetical protein